MLLLILICGILRTVTGDCEVLNKRQGVDVKCVNQNTGGEIDCYSRMLPSGTVVTYECVKTFYVPNDDIKTGKMTCRGTKWTGINQFKYFRCIVNCGVSIVKRASGFVIGGVDTTISDWPWHASIYARRNLTSPFVYICGGTLINPYNKGFVILTAAHCLADANIKPRDARNVKVVLGAETSTLEDNYEVEGAQVHNVRKIILHDSYEGESKDYLADISLVALEKKVKLDLTVLPACFSESVQSIQIGKEGYAVGFGRHEHNGQSVSVTLRRVKLPVVNNDLCFEWRGRKLSPLEFCAGYLNSQSTCNGDSGGGVFFPEQKYGTQRYFVQGIISHGKRDLENRRETCDSYSVFTKVTSYADWIKKTVDDLVLNEDDQSEISEPNIYTSTHSPPPTITTKTRTTTPIFPMEEYQTQRPQSPPRPNRPTQPQFSNPPQIPNSSQKSYDESSLERHNYYRNLHHAPPLRLNTNLKRRAQAYADKLIRDGTFQNENEEGINKNVYYIGGPQPKLERAVVLAIDSWYEEIKSYNWDNPYYNTFSQIVWKSTRDIGTGIASDGRRTIVVTAYSPPGNILGEDGKYFKENVSPQL